MVQRLSVAGLAVLFPVGIYFCFARDLFLPLYFAGPFVAIALKSWYAPTTAQLASLRDDPPTIDQYLVNLAFYRDGALYAFDSGHVSFVEGWLVYSGLACDFSFRSMDTHLDDTPKFTCKDCMPHANFRWYMTTNGPSPILILIACKSRQKDFDEAFKEWYIRADHPIGKPVFPPRYPQPSVRHDARVAWLINWIIGIAVVSIVAALYVIEDLGPNGSGINIGEVFIFLLIMSLLSTWWFLKEIRPSHKWVEQLSRFDKVRKDHSEPLLDQPVTVPPVQPLDDSQVVQVREV